MTTAEDGGDSNIERVGVVGCGLMGSGIAEVCARAGLDVIVREVNQGALDAGRKRIEGSLDRAVRSGKLPETERDEALSRLRYTLDFGEFADRQLVVVAVAGPTAEGAHARQQLLEGEGLGQVVVGAGVQTAHAIRYGVARREHQYWRAQPLSPQLAGNLDAVHLGQHHVEHHQVMRAAFGAGQPLEAVVRHFDAVPDIGQRPLYHPRNTRIVLHHQYVHIVRCHHKYGVILRREPWNSLEGPAHCR